MATTPHPAPKPEPPKPPPPAAKNDRLHDPGQDKHAPLKSHSDQPAVIAGRGADRDLGPSGYGPTIGVMGEPIEDGERDPDTIAEEQRRRSEEIEKVGVDAWVKAHDDRDRDGDDERAPKKVVPGVTAAEKR